MDYQELTKQLMACESRGKAFTLLGKQNFTKKQLLDYADYLSIHVNGYQSKDLIRASIISFTAGSVLNSKAIRGRY